MWSNACNLVKCQQRRGAKSRLQMSPLAQLEVRVMSFWYTSALKCTACGLINTVKCTSERNVISFIQKSMRSNLVLGWSVLFVCSSNLFSSNTVTAVIYSWMEEHRCLSGPTSKGGSVSRASIPLFLPLDNAYYSSSLQFACLHGIYPFYITNGCHTTFAHCITVNSVWQLNFSF